MSVFYPADKEEYEASPQPNKAWLDYNKDDIWIESLQDARQYYSFLNERPSSVMFRFWRHLTVHAKENLGLATHFRNSAKKGKGLIPIIMSHGITANRCLYQTICIELASFGYMVLAIDHHDGSGTYSEKKDGTPIPLDTSGPRNEMQMNGPGQKWMGNAMY